MLLVDSNTIMVKWLLLVLGYGLLWHFEITERRSTYSLRFLLLHLIILIILSCLTHFKSSKWWLILSVGLVKKWRRIFGSCWLLLSLSNSFTASSNFKLSKSRLFFRLLLIHSRLLRSYITHPEVTKTRARIFLLSNRFLHISSRNSFLVFLGHFKSTKWAALVICGLVHFKWWERWINTLNLFFNFRRIVLNLSAVFNLLINFILLKLLELILVEILSPLNLLEFLHLFIKKLCLYWFLNELHNVK